MTDAGGKRRNTRVPFHVTVTLAFPGGTYSRCETRDLSIRGVFVVGVRGPRVGEACQTELCLSGTSSSVCLSMKSTVVRTDDEGLALRFTEVDIDSFFHLRNIVYYNAGDPDSIEEFIPFDDVAG